MCNKKEFEKYKEEFDMEMRVEVQKRKKVKKDIKLLAKKICDKYDNTMKDLAK